MKDLVLHLAGSDDAESVGRLIDAMDAHYNGAGNTAGLNGAVRLARATIDSREGTHFLVAEHNGHPAGLACFAVIRPGRRHTGLIFLKDLFVMPETRSAGVGRAMLAWLAQYALNEGIGRIDLTTEHANKRAQVLYEELGGERRETLMYRFDGKTLWTLANKRPDKA